MEIGRALLFFFEGKGVARVGRGRRGVAPSVKGRGEQERWASKEGRALGEDKGGEWEGEGLGWEGGRGGVE